MLELLKALDSKNIVYVSWKNNHQLEETIAGASDLDLLVPEDSYSDFLGFAKDRGWVEFENPVPKLSNVNSGALIVDHAIRK